MTKYLVFHSVPVHLMSRSNVLNISLNNIKHLLGEPKSNIRFVLPGQVMLGVAKLRLTSLDPAKLI